MASDGYFSSGSGNPPYVWRGHKNLERGPATWDFSAEKVTVSFTYQGPLSICIAQRPLIGSTIVGFTDFRLRVASAKVVEGAADTARLDITLEAPVTSSSDPTPLGDPIYELEFGGGGQPLELHPKCGILKADRPHYKDGVKVSQTDATANGTTDKGKQRTWEDWADLDDYDYDGGDGLWTLATYKAKKEAGEDGYEVAVPIVRRTLEYFTKPPGVGADVDKRQNPPGAADAPSGYEWLCKHDSCTKEGRKRTRRTEWQGFAKIDHDLYPAGA